VLTNTIGTTSRPNCSHFVTQRLRVNLPNGHLLPRAPTTILYQFLISSIALHLQPLSFVSDLLKPTNYDAQSATSLFLCCLYDQLFTHLHKSQHQLSLTVRPAKLFLQASTPVHACHMQNHTRYWQAGSISKPQYAFGKATTCHESNTGVNKPSPEDARIRTLHVCVFVCLFVCLYACTQPMYVCSVTTMLTKFLTFQCQLRKPSKRQTRPTIVTYRSVRHNTEAN